ncbi:MAG TPA: metallophosphoesterase family protein [Solirubrobacteraceae bacterium]|jgi:diadenosine tetraphosphatase ApaH/serine/threonine PP2A family protein phosphatase|nr:metallophosphoesterase family protein [Solirubrobacteraceae bacterium]
MRVAIVSDIHGNQQAFEAVLEDLAGVEHDAIWCLGDLVGYGAAPDACVERARSDTDLCLVGNHDLAVRGDLPLTEFSRGAALAAEWTRDTIDEGNLSFLGELEPADVHQVVGLYHASPRDPVWEYVLSSLQADLCLSAQRHRVCLIGHSHVALAFGRQDGSPTSGEIRGAGSELDVSEGEWLLNPGSVGQPRDGDPRAAWLLLDTDAWVARWRRVPYDIGAAAAAIRAANLPEALAERLQYGQ